MSLAALETGVTRILGLYSCGGAPSRRSSAAAAAAAAGLQASIDLIPPPSSFCVSSFSSVSSSLTASSRSLASYPRRSLRCFLSRLPSLAAPLHLDHFPSLVSSVSFLLTPSSSPSLDIPMFLPLSLSSSELCSCGIRFLLTPCPVSSLPT